VGSRAGLDGCGKSRPPPPGIDPRPVQPVAKPTELSRPTNGPWDHGYYVLDETVML